MLLYLVISINEQSIVYELKGLRVYKVFISVVYAYVYSQTQTGFQKRLPGP